MVDIVGGGARAVKVGKNRKCGVMAFAFQGFTYRGADRESF
jgi:hypothetical protein